MDSFFITPHNQAIELFLQSERSIQFWQDIPPLRRRYLSSGHIQPTHFACSDSTQRPEKGRSTSLEELRRVKFVGMLSEDAKTKLRAADQRLRSPINFERAKLKRGRRESLADSSYHSRSRSVFLEDILSEATCSEDKLTSRSEESKLSIKYYEETWQGMSDSSIARNVANNNGGNRNSGSVRKAKLNASLLDTKKAMSKLDLDLVTYEREAQLSAVEQLLEASDSDYEEGFINGTADSRENHSNLNSDLNLADVSFLRDGQNSSYQELLFEEECRNLSDSIRNEICKSASKTPPKNTLKLGEEGNAGPFGCVITFESRSASMEDVGSPRALEEALVSLTSNSESRMDGFHCQVQSPKSSNTNSRKIEGASNRQTAADENERSRFDSPHGKFASINKLKLFTSAESEKREFWEDSNSICGLENSNAVVHDLFNIDVSEIEENNFEYDSGNSEDGRYPIDIKGINSDDSTGKNNRQNSGTRVKVQKTIITKNIPEIVRIEEIDEPLSRAEKTHNSTSSKRKISGRKSKSCLLQPPSEGMDTTIESDEDMKYDVLANSRQASSSDSKSKSHSESNLSTESANESDTLRHKRSKTYCQCCKRRWSKRTKSRSRRGHYEVKGTSTSFKKTSEKGSSTSISKCCYEKPSKTNSPNCLCPDETLSDQQMSSFSLVSSSSSSTENTTKISSRNPQSASSDIDSKTYNGDDVTEEDNLEIPKIKNSGECCSHSKCQEIRQKHRINEHKRNYQVKEKKNMEISLKQIKQPKSKLRLKNISVQTSARLSYPMKETSIKPDTCDKETYVKHFTFTEISTQTNGSQFSPLPNKFNKTWIETPKGTKTPKSGHSLVEQDEVSLRSELDRFEHNVRKLRSAEEKLKGSVNVGHVKRGNLRHMRTPKDTYRSTDDTPNSVHIHNHEHYHHGSSSMSPSKQCTSLLSSPDRLQWSKSASQKTTARSILISSPAPSYIRKVTNYEPYSTKIIRDKGMIFEDFKPYRTNTNVTINRTYSLESNNFPTSSIIPENISSFRHRSVGSEGFRTNSSQKLFTEEQNTGKDDTLQLLGRLRHRLQNILSRGAKSVQQLYPKHTLATSLDHLAGKY